MPRGHVPIAGLPPGGEQMLIGFTKFQKNANTSRSAGARRYIDASVGDIITCQGHYHGGCD